MKHLMRILLACAAVSALLLLGLLAWSTTNASRIERFYPLLVALNTVVALALGAWVVILTTRLVRQLRRHQFGARLTARMALAFTLVGIVPGVLIYTLSVQLLSRSIESWFNVRVNAALDAGLNLGRAALDSQLADLNGKARAMALELGQLADPTDTNIALELTRQRERLGVPEVVAFTSNGSVIAFSTSTYGVLAPPLPPHTVLQRLRTGRGYSAAESADAEGHGLNLRVIVPLITRTDYTDLSSVLRPDARYLQVMQPVPEQIAVNANQVQTGYRDYQELALSRLGLRKLYGITLTLALFLAAFTSIAAAFALSSRLVRPLLRLAAGTQAVSVGDYRQLPEPPSRDEVGQLTRSFNAMTRQLAEARRMVEKNRLQLERSNAYLENVLSTLSSGVLVFDDAFRVTTVNQGAQRILGTDLRTVPGRPLETVPHLEAFAKTIRQTFAEHTAAATGRSHWQQQLEVVKHHSDTIIEQAPPEPFSHRHDVSTTAILLVRGSHLVVEGGAGYVVVFDDITDVISANRVVAWGEVARRLAHEIKNPLTPIQLSAERLLFKLEAKLAEPDAALLRRATTTIVNQVSSMQSMVNDFREYARTPSLTLIETDLNALVADVLALYGWDPELMPHGSGEGARLEVSLAGDLPLIQSDPTRIRQIVHNLLTNAHDAISPGEPGSGSPPGVIHVATRQANSRLSDGTTLAAVQLTVADSGQGFPENVLQRAFEPYVTTKPKGTGLGLAIVKKIVEEHGGRIELANRPEGGAIVSILLTRLVNRAGAPDSGCVVQDGPEATSLHE